MVGYGGKPVTVSNLPSAVFQEYVQHRSVDHRHRSEQMEFQYSDTNAFTSKLDVGSR